MKIKYSAASSVVSAARALARSNNWVGTAGFKDYMKINWQARVNVNVYGEVTSITFNNADLHDKFLNLLSEI